MSPCSYKVILHKGVPIRGWGVVWAKHSVDHSFPNEFAWVRVSWESHCIPAYQGFHLQDFLDSRIWRWVSSTEFLPRPSQLLLLPPPPLLFVILVAIAPPRAEGFCWSAVPGKMLTREHLLTRWVIPPAPVPLFYAPYVVGDRPMIAVFVQCNLA